MGRVKNLEIVLAGNRSVFQRGEVVRGKLIVEVEKILKVRWIRMVIRGVARVHWTESRNNGARLGGYGMLYTEHFTAEVEYVNKKLVLLGTENGEARETLTEGRHEYRFSFTLPQSSIATSFEGKYGSIRYWLKAEVGKPWAFSFKTKKPFTVISPIDINRSEFMTPSEAAVEKQLCCWWCMTAPVSAEIRTDRRGYCPGESIAISALFTNGTRRHITPHATLYQIQSFTANGKSRSRGIKLTTVSGVNIAPGETGYWDAQLLKVPAVSPSILNCQLIKVDYLIKITLQIPGACNVHVDVPIVIGTVPCRRPRQRMPAGIVRAPNSETPHLRAAGPPAYQDLEEELPYEAPPTYAECISGPVDVIDEDDDDAQLFGSTSYTPMYTYVYEHHYMPPPPYACADRDQELTATADAMMERRGRSIMSPEDEEDDLVLEVDDELLRSPERVELDNVSLYETNSSVRPVSVYRQSASQRRHNRDRSPDYDNISDFISIV